MLIFGVLPCHERVFNIRKFGGVNLEGLNFSSEWRVLYQAEALSQDRVQQVRKQQKQQLFMCKCVLVHPGCQATLTPFLKFLEPVWACVLNLTENLQPSLDNLGHLTPSFGLLLRQGHPGRLVLGQCWGRQASRGGWGLAGKPWNL